jgi:hypothetical protein
MEQPGMMVEKPKQPKICQCERGPEEFRCEREDCPNFGLMYCQECLNEAKLHLHPAKRYQPPQLDEAFLRFQALHKHFETFYR